MIRDEISKMVFKQLYKRGYNIFTDNNTEKGDLIVDKVLSGIFAVRLIYNDDYEIEQVIDLDWRLVKLGDLVSIDGGKNYQWDFNEVLLFDVDSIRDLKIKYINKK